MSERSRALVTGASSGIGAAVARQLAADGLAIAVHHASGRDRAEAVLAELPGAGHCVVGGDLGDPDGPAEVLAAAVDGLGGVDVVVANAGIYVETPIEETDYAQWQRVWRRTLEVNVLGPAGLAWAFADHVRRTERSGARLVVVGSRGAYRGEPLAPAYGASKAAVHSLAQSLAVALAPRIAVSAVAPGFVRTERTAPILDGPRGEGIRAQSPYGRTGEVAEIAAAVAWLASPEAVWASGAVLDLNGASYLR
jgi:3-oxoacyl-[acyl-carrier protein] reductase